MRPARSIHERTPVTRGVLCLPGPRPTPFSCPGGARRGGAPQPVTTAERLGAGGDSRAGLPRGLHASFRAPGAGGCGGPREAPLAAPTLGVLALHGAENLIAPPGGRGWGQVPRDLIGAGQSPGRSPETSRSGESAAQGRNGAGGASQGPPSSSSPGFVPKKCQLRSRAPGNASDPGAWRAAVRAQHGKSRENESES